MSDDEAIRVFGADDFVHYYRSVTDLKCTVVTEAGECASFDGMDPIFRDPNVNDVFPAATFLNFIEMKNPEAFSAIRLDGVPVPFEFNLAGDDPELIPVPLGERRKKGQLTVEISAESQPVKSVRLELSVANISRRVRSSDGRHFAYGPPGEPQHALSEYRTEMFGMPVEIEHHSERDGSPVAPTLKFPSGLNLPGTIINPRLYDVEAIDVDRLSMKPITIVLKNGETAQGVIVAPVRELIPDEQERKRFAQEAFMFITRADLEWMKKRLRTTPRARMKRDIVRVIPKRVVEYVDISAALGSE